MEIEQAAHSRFPWESPAMASSDHPALRQTPLIRTLSLERSISTSLRSGKDFALIAFANGSIYRAGAETEDVETIAQIPDVWSLAYRDNSAIFGSLNGELHLLDVQAK